MLAHSYQFQLANLLLYFFRISFQSALLNCSLSHSRRQFFKIEVGNISLVSLEVGIVPKKLVELIPPWLALQQNVFTMRFELLLNLYSYRIGQHSLPSPELHINKLRSYQFVLKSLLSDKLSLKMIVCCILNFLARSTFNKRKQFILFKMLLIKL